MDLDVDLNPICSCCFPPVIFKLLHQCSVKLKKKAHVLSPSKINTLGVIKHDVYF